MTWTAGAANRGVPPTFAAPRRRTGRRVGVAVGLVLLALLVVDCLNLSQSTNWTDLRQGPHMAAVHQARVRSSPTPQDAGARQSATLAAPLLLVVTLLVLVVTLRPARVPGVRSRHGPRPRGPPTLRFT
jgi:hypothetical protein